MNLPNWLRRLVADTPEPPAPLPKRIRPSMAQLNRELGPEWPTEEMPVYDQIVEERLHALGIPPFGKFANQVEADLAEYTRTGGAR